MRTLPISINLQFRKKRKKWLLCCSYNSYKSDIANHLIRVCETLDKLNATYDNLILLGNFNAKAGEESIVEFLSLYNLKSLAEQNTCFKNSDKSTYIVLILTNCPRSFQNTDTKIVRFLQLTFKSAKPLFSDEKSQKKFFSSAINITDMFNDYSSNFVQNLNISRGNSS